MLFDCPRSRIDCSASLEYAAAHTMEPGLCLANIELSESRMGRGFLSHLLQDLQSHADALDLRWLTMESVLNRSLVAFIVRQGFVKMTRDGSDPFDGTGSTYALRITSPVDNSAKT